jgi:hypothetical protein
MKVDLAQVALADSKTNRSAVDSQVVQLLNRWTIKPLVVAVATIAIAGCAPAPTKPEQVPGQSQDPGRFEEAEAETADRAAKREEAKAQRERATQRRMVAFDSDCNIVTFFFGLFIKDSVCAGPVHVGKDKPQHLL